MFNIQQKTKTYIENRNEQTLSDNGRGYRQ